MTVTNSQQLGPQVLLPKNILKVSFKVLQF